MPGLSSSRKEKSSKAAAEETSAGGGSAGGGAGGTPPSIGASSDDLPLAIQTFLWRQTRLVPPIFVLSTVENDRTPLFFFPALSLDQSLESSTKQLVW